MVMNQQQLRKLYDELVSDIFTKPDYLKSIVDNQLAKREGFHHRDGLPAFHFKCLHYPVFIFFAGHSRMASLPDTSRIRGMVLDNNRR